MSIEPEKNPIPTSVKDLLALFEDPEGPLKEVNFPDVDGAALREQASEVEAAVAEVEAAAQAWAEAKRKVDSRLESLLQKAQRALAYARVYAEDKPELDATLAGIVVPKWGDPRGTKTAGAGSAASAARNVGASHPSASLRKRGRPKKGAVEVEAPKPDVAADVAEAPRPQALLMPPSDASPSDASPSDASPSDATSSDAAPGEEPVADEGAV